jgi:RNA polymerase sigma-B factor
LNQNLARKSAHKFAATSPESFEDLFQIASIGLLKAIKRFDPARGFAFSSFAMPYINGEILHWLRDHWVGAKIPRSAVEFHGKVNRLQRELERTGKVLTHTHVAKILGTDKEEWQWISEAMARHPMLNLDELGEAIADPKELSIPEVVTTYPELYGYIGGMDQPYRRCFLAHAIQGQSVEAIALMLNLPLDQIQEYLDEGLLYLRKQLEAACERTNPD